MKFSQMVRLDELAPIRRQTTSRRALTGRVSVDGGGRAGFESSLERDWLICLDFDPSVVFVLEQPFSIVYEENGRERRYTPDVLARYRLPDGGWSTVVYEIKPRADLRAEFAEYRTRFKKAIAICRGQGWRFKIVTESHIRTPYLKNAKFLRRYRTMSVQPLYRDQLLYSLRALGPTTPQALLALAYTYHEKRMAALTELWRMIANREISANFDEPLAMQSRIWSGEDDE